MLLHFSVCQVIIKSVKQSPNLKQTKKLYFLIFQNTKVLLPENNEKAKSVNSFQKGSGEHM